MCANNDSGLCRDCANDLVTTDRAAKQFRSSIVLYSALTYHGYEQAALCRVTRRVWGRANGRVLVGLYVALNHLARFGSVRCPFLFGTRVSAIFSFLCLSDPFLMELTSDAPPRKYEANKKKKKGKVDSEKRKPSFQLNSPDRGYSA